MKIIHTGDIHLGAAMKNLPHEKANQRKAEILDGFGRLCTYARENGVSAVLIAGDLFDETAISSSLKNQVLSLIAAAKPTVFFYVSGNHDEGLLLENLPDNFYTFSQNRSWQAYALGENVTVTGMDTAYFSLHNFSALALNPDTFNIVLLHGNLGGDTNAKEYLPLAYFQNKYIDYLALGHIHAADTTAKRLDARGRYRYCGCPEGRGFDETGKKGFFLIEIQNGLLVQEKFLTFARREIVEKYVDISRCNTYLDLENAALEALKNEHKDNVIKLVLCGNYTAGLQKNTQLLATRLSERFFFVKTYDESRLFLNPDEYKNDCTERGEFIREVGRYGLNGTLRDEILEIGLKALAGEDIDV